MAPSALFKAIYQNNVEVVKHRIKMGDDVNHRKRRTRGYTALHEAIAWNRLEIADLLLFF
jgi:ankyrin repeat protein